MQENDKNYATNYKIAYASEAIVFHSHDYSTWQEFKRYFDMGVFYNCEASILHRFGKPEGEGLKYIKDGLIYLFNNNKQFLIPHFFLKAFIKYLGYRIGLNYNLLPAYVTKKVSMNPNWWNKNIIHKN